jgi:hypothetical protein
MRQTRRAPGLGANLGPVGCVAKPARGLARSRGISSAGGARPGGRTTDWLGEKLCGGQRCLADDAHAAIDCD